MTFRYFPTKFDDRKILNFKFKIKLSSAKQLGRKTGSNSLKPTKDNFISVGNFSSPKSQKKNLRKPLGKITFLRTILTQIK